MQCLVNQNQHIETATNRHSDESRRKYKIHLGCSIQIVRILIRQGLAFRGNDEGSDSSNKGNFLEILEWLGNNNKTEIQPYIMENARGNLRLTSPTIQKDITSAISYEIISTIMSDIGDSFFSILVDESKDISCKEQMAIVLRYVKDGNVIECFVGIEHVKSTTTLLLKETIDNFFSRHGLSISMLRGQGFDGASNMRAVVAVATRNPEIKDLFSLVTCVTNVVGGSPKRLEILREIQGVELYEAISMDEIETETGLNQITNLKRATDTRWGSYQNTLISLIGLYYPVMGVLKSVSEDLTSEKRICKKRLQEMMDKGCDSLLVQVSSFCEQYGIKVINMDDDSLLSDKDRPVRNAQKITNMHIYHVEIYNAVIDLQLKELNNRFTETTTELLLCVSCLCPTDSFSSFAKDKLMRLAQFYPRDFSSVDLARLDDQLENYIIDMRSIIEFSGLKGITDLAKKMVKTRKDKVYQLVYLLLTLALILPVATSSVERLFSAMNLLKTRLCNRMGDEWLNDCLLAYVEKLLLDLITDDMIMQRFHIMKNRKGQLPKNVVVA